MKTEETHSREGSEKREIRKERQEERTDRQKKETNTRNLGKGNEHETWQSRRG